MIKFTILKQNCVNMTNVIYPAELSAPPTTPSTLERAKYFGYSVVSCFNAYVFRPIENYLIGDLRTFNAGQFEADGKASGFAQHSFGRWANVAIWRPRSNEELAAVLNEL